LDDGFQDFHTVKKPHPTATEGKHSGKPLYIESEERLPCSAIRQDDIEVYLRVKTFRNQIFRVPNKLISFMKWMKYTDRYEILRESRRSMIKLRNEYKTKQRELCMHVSDTLREKLVRAGIDTEKVVTAVVDTYTKSLRGVEYSSKAEELLSTTTYDYAKLPLLHTLAIELKYCLKSISKEFDITGDLEVDNGHSFTYQIQVHFPVLFQKHVENSKFDLYDTFPEDEESALQPRASKANQLENLQSYAKSETKKSMLGYINSDDLPQITGDISKDTVIKTESFTKLKASYWLEYICFSPTIDPLYKKQSLLFQVKADNLLDSYFNFLDVNDCSAVNKILDDASILHTQRAQKRNPLRNEAGQFISFDKELEQNLSLAANREGSKKSLEFEIEPLIEPIPIHIVKGLYMLRYLKARDFKSKLLNALNYYREIQKRLT